MRLSAPATNCIAAVLALSLAAIGSARVARADGGPVIVIPSRPGIPIVIQGVDASYAVVEGDWGLSRPGHGVVTVIGGMPVLPNPVYHQRRTYHPRFGYPPQRGRFEIEPPPDRAPPEPAETFSRSWSTLSAPPPVHPLAPPASEVSPTIVDPYTFQQPMIVAPPSPRGGRK